ncbi:NADPH-dependent oxidoreductase [Arcanobacterium pinnipediorum]|uniref:NADPH-dependent oxidoreductase n=1 Tax=Arcanobacterium pinnipediorum TaxID=1503041 RepID=A0ABY5AFJ8_9ACTO|nr:NADPH-dependent oxidoreductase [Arcanobacterium pinnipediorum]USR78718.1 NADPH-dependent oxidoreductase [Arcanobacterium pinnipediorum]
MTNQTISQQLNHRSIRKFSQQSVPQDVNSTLFDVAMRTSTSRGFQHAGLIRVTDQGLRNKLAEIGNQPYIAQAPEFVVAIVDTRRSVRILEELGHDPSPAKSMDAFREGFTDAILMVQNMTVAAESMGLGVTLLGSILNDIPEVISLLHLPDFTFPALGMIYGYPDQEPQLKPRMDVNLRVMHNTYNEPESWVEALADYDQEMTTYYDTRDLNRRVDTFTTQVVRKLRTTPLKDRYIDHVRSQGFGQ